MDMDKTCVDPNEKEQEHKNRQSLVEAMIPAGLTGQIRDKARDAAMTAMVILGMSRMDIMEHVQQLALDNGLTPQSARVWLLFNKEIQDQAQSVGRQVGGKGSRHTYAQGLGYSRNDTKTIGLGAVFRRAVTGIGAGKKGSAVDDMRVEMNREAGHHGDSIQGRNGAFSYDQMVDGWTGTGGDGQSAGAIGLDGLEGDTGLEIGHEDSVNELLGSETDHPDGSDQVDDKYGKPGVGDKGGRQASPYVVDQQDAFLAGASGSLNGGWFKAAQQQAQQQRSQECRNGAMDRAIAGLDRKVGGFRGTNEEFAAFAKANPDLDKNQLRLLRKGLSDKDYLGWRVYVENKHLLGNKGQSDSRIVTQTKACLLMVSEDSARRAQNDMRAKVRLFSRIPDPGVEKLSIEHLERMQKSMPRLVEEHRVRVEAKEIRKAGKKRDEPDLER
jgi:hypothetical protein